MKILFVLYQKPGAIPDGGDQCNLRNIDLVCEICGKNNVDFYYIIKEQKSKLQDAISFYVNIFHNYYRGINKAVINEINTIVKQYDCVFLCSSLFGVIVRELKESGFEGKIVSQFHNVELNYYKIVFPKWLPLRSRILECIRQNELMSAHYSDVILALNERDGKQIKEDSGKLISYYDSITLADKLDKSRIGDSLTCNRPLCAFIGSNFPPNAEGILWFVNKVLPFVEIDFMVVGRNMDELKKKNACLQKIMVLSDVPDLSEYFIKADFIVSPIFSGSGMKVKTCEGLMYGKNILGTTEAFEGYSLDYNKVGGLCNTAEDFIRTINSYGANPIMRFNEYSRNVYESKYSNESIRKTFEHIFCGK